MNVPGDSGSGHCSFDHYFRLERTNIKENPFKLNLLVFSSEFPGRWESLLSMIDFYHYNTNQKIM